MFSNFFCKSQNFQNNLMEARFKKCAFAIVFMSNFISLPCSTNTDVLQWRF